MRPKQPKPFARSYWIGVRAPLAVFFGLLFWSVAFCVGARAAGNTEVPVSAVFWKSTPEAVQTKSRECAGVAGGPEFAAKPLGEQNSRDLLCWFGFETERDERYVVSRRFAIWTNQQLHCNIVLSNLVSGGGNTVWETNLVQVRSRTNESELLVEGEVVADHLPAQCSAGLISVTVEPYHLGSGTCACGALAFPGRPGPVSGGLHLRFGLGLDRFGKPVGELSLSADTLRPDLCRPSALHLFALDQVVSVDWSNGHLRRIVAPECIVELSRENASSCKLEFFARNDSLTGLSSHGMEKLPTEQLPILTTWRLETRTIEGKTDQLTCIQENGSGAVTNFYTWTGTGWLASLGNGLRVEVCSSQTESGLGRRTVVREIRDPKSNTVLARQTQEYRRFLWGEEMVCEVNGLGPEAQTNRFSFCEERGCPGWSRLKQAEFASGMWEHFEYDSLGRLARKYSPYLNTPPEMLQSGRCEERAYEPWTKYGDEPQAFPLRFRTLTERVGAITTGKTYFLANSSRNIEVRSLQNSSVEPFDGPSLSTTNWVLCASAHRKDLPDGSVQIDETLIGPENITNVCSVGVLDDEGRKIVLGNRTIAIMGRHGELVSRRIYEISPLAGEVLIESEDRVYGDTLKRSYEALFLDGSKEMHQFGCCGREAHTDRDGQLTTWLYDALSRVTREVRFNGSDSGLQTLFGYDAANHLEQVTEFARGNKLPRAMKRQSFDSLGRVVCEDDVVKGVTTFSYFNVPRAGVQTTTSYADGGLKIQQSNRDGSVSRVLGRAGTELNYVYALLPDGSEMCHEVRRGDGFQPLAQNDLTEWLLKPSESNTRETSKVLYALQTSKRAFRAWDNLLFTLSDPKLAGEPQASGNANSRSAAASCSSQFYKALQTRRNRKLLQEIQRAGCDPPNIRPVDSGGYCSIPGFLGEYDCQNREGKICCLNVANQSDVERIVHHELVHAVDCCRHGLESCDELICSEIAAYYYADCEWFSNRLECALNQMRASLAGKKDCAEAVKRANKQTAHDCLERWRKRLREGL